MLCLVWEVEGAAGVVFESKHLLLSRQDVYRQRTHKLRFRENLHLVCLSFFMLKRLLISPMPFWLVYYCLCLYEMVTACLFLVHLNIVSGWAREDGGREGVSPGLMGSLLSNIPGLSLFPLLAEQKEFPVINKSTVGPVCAVTSGPDGSCSQS